MRRIRPEITYYNEMCHESFEQFICHQFTYKSISVENTHEGISTPKYEVGAPIFFRQKK